MAEIINLRLARKAKSRVSAASVADANRARHGQSKAAKALAKAEAERAARLLEGSMREPD